LLVFFSLKNTCASCQIYSVEQNHTPEAQLFKKMILLLWHYKEGVINSEPEPQVVTKTGQERTLSQFLTQLLACKRVMKNTE
jgi:hypothetical protein